jgi:hypothetical protein
LACPPTAFPYIRKLKCRLIYAPLIYGLHVGLDLYLMAIVIIGSVSVTYQDPPSAQGTFAHNRCYLLCCGVLHHIRGSYPSFFAHTGPCARPGSSCCLRLSLLQQVFAGCRQSLLESGPSRHYLCNPCVGAWTPTPQCPSGAFARFFPEDSDLTSDVTGSAH